MIVIEHHSAAARTHLRVSVRENDSDQADVYGKSGIDVFVKNLGNPGHGGIVAEVECLSMSSRVVAVASHGRFRAGALRSRKQIHPAIDPRPQGCDSSERTCVQIAPAGL